MKQIKKINITYDGNIALLTLSSSYNYNALNKSLIDELHNALDKIESHANAKVMIINSSCQHFCVGADLKWFNDLCSFTPCEKKNHIRLLASLFSRLTNFKKPSIALVNGKTLGGGCGIFSCCDFVIAATNAKFSFSETKIGVTPATIAPYIIRRIGWQTAKRYFLTAELFPAEVALNIQLVDQLSIDENLLSSGYKLAKTICQNNQNAIIDTKNLLNQLENVSNETVELSITTLNKTLSSAAAQEGIKAFLEKRTPNWK